MGKRRPGDDDARCPVRGGQVQEPVAVQTYRDRPSAHSHSIGTPIHPSEDVPGITGNFGHQAAIPVHPHHICRLYSPDHQIVALPHRHVNSLRPGESPIQAQHPYDRRRYIGLGPGPGQDNIVDAGPHKDRRDPEALHPAGVYLAPIGGHQEQKFLLLTGPDQPRQGFVQRGDRFQVRFRLQETACIFHPAQVHQEDERRIQGLYQIDGGVQTPGIGADAALDPAPCSIRGKLVSPSTEPRYQIGRYTGSRSHHRLRVQGDSDTFAEEEEGVLLQRQRQGALLEQGHTGEVILPGQVEHRRPLQRLACPGTPGDQYVVTGTRHRNPDVQHPGTTGEAEERRFSHDPTIVLGIDVGRNHPVDHQYHRSLGMVWWLPYPNLGQRLSRAQKQKKKEDL